MARHTLPKPPIGSLRWRAPQPPEPWTETREALDFGPACTQFAGLIKKAPAGQEDCLYLNIYAPRFAEDQVPIAGARLPVMFWIHAGSTLAATHKVVVITTNYRLGPFGLFRHAALRADTANELDRSGNFGTLDLVRALQWVHENVAAFGGDPDNVTIFGESAGGLNVYTLLLSPLARGLFQRAISESGVLSPYSIGDPENFTDDAEPEHVGSSNEVLLRLLIKDGLSHDRAAAKARLADMKLPGVARYLRGKTNSEILSVYTEEHTGIFKSRMPFAFRNGVVLPKEDAMQRFAQPDGYNRVPVMLGTNRDEYKVFMLSDPTHVRRIMRIIPRMRDERQYNLIAEYQSNSFKTTGVDEPATLLRATQGPSVFACRFDWDEEPRIPGTDLAVMVGAAHGVEIPFVSDDFDLSPIIFTKKNEPGRQALSAQMMSYWAEFAYHGAPGRGRDGSLPEWTPWDNSAPKSPKFMILDTATDGGLRMSPDMVSEKSLLAAIDADPRLPTQRGKCKIYRELASWGGYTDFTTKEYPTAGKNGCKEFPFDKYPWK